MVPGKQECDCNTHARLLPGEGVGLYLSIIATFDGLVAVNYRQTGLI